MRVRINNQLTAKQKKMLNAESEKAFYSQIEKYNKMIVLQIMYILHFDFGFGKKRIGRFFTKLKEMQESHIKRYEVKDDDVPDICEIKLREAGLSVTDFFE